MKMLAHKTELSAKIFNEETKNENINEKESSKINYCTHYQFIALSNIQIICTLKISDYFMK